MTGIFVDGWQQKPELVTDGDFVLGTHSTYQIVKREGGRWYDETDSDITDAVLGGGVAVLRLIPPLGLSKKAR